MKKKIVNFILAICLIMPCIFLFSACGKNSDDYEFLQYSVSVIMNSDMLCRDTYHVISVEVEGQMKSETLTYSAGDFSIRTTSKVYKALHFAVRDENTYQWTESLKPYVATGTKSTVIDGLYEYRFKMNIIIDDEEERLTGNDIASLYYKGKEVYVLN